MYNQFAAQSQAELVERYAPLVKRIAHHLLARLPASVQLDDLIQAGMVGLLEAARKYDAGKGASFETYAGIRIRGAIIDEVRRGDWTPRSVHRNGRRISEAIQTVEARTGRDAQDHEIAAELGMSVDEYHGILRDAASARLFSIDEVRDGHDDAMVADLASDQISPQAEVTRERFRAALAEAIGKLSEREQLVLSLYYDEELNLKEIGQILGVSESRISQIHSQAALRLRARLRDWISSPEA